VYAIHPRKNKPACRWTITDPAQREYFNRFYSAFPRHVARAAAEDAWAELNPDLALAERIIAGAKAYAEVSEGVARNYIKHPGPWLNDRRWEDDEQAQTRKEPKFVNV
jgi:hypothetical protein